MRRCANKRCYGPQTVPQNGDQEYLVYLMPGNPAVIAYYDLFMSRLATRLNAASQSKRYFVYGCSLPGFDIYRREFLVDRKLPCGLVEQIENIEALIEKALENHVERSDTLERKPKVVLVGHSIGCYIMLEILRRRKAKDGPLHGVDIVGGVLLFPTITYIGQSRNGRIATVSMDVQYHRGRH
jgi:pimeloyl-ACP methyl ester carboxylesterase